MRNARARTTLFVFLALIALGCEDEATPLDAGSSLDAGDAAPARDAAPEGMLTESESAAVISAIDTGEIDLATLALERATDADVRALATTISEESAALQQDLAASLLERMLAPSEGATSARIQRGGMATRRRLQSLQGPAFERAYLDAEIASHEETLALIDQRMLPVAMDPGFRALLERLRSETAARLAMAQQLAASPS